MVLSALEKAEILVEALPYIKNSMVARWLSSMAALL